MSSVSNVSWTSEIVLSLNLRPVFKGPQASSCQDALFLWELEKMDSATGRCAVHTVAVSCPALVYLGTAEVRGQFEQMINLIDMWLNFDSASRVGLANT